MRNRWRTWRRYRRILRRLVDQHGNRSYTPGGYQMYKREARFLAERDDAR